MDSIFPRHGASRKPGTVHFQAAGDIAQRRSRRVNGAPPAALGAGQRPVPRWRRSERLRSRTFGRRPPEHVNGRSTTFGNSSSLRPSRRTARRSLRSSGPGRPGSLAGARTRCCACASRLPAGYLSGMLRAVVPMMCRRRVVGTSPTGYSIVDVLVVPAPSASFRPFRSPRCPSGSSIVARSVHRLQPPGRMSSPRPPLRLLCGVSGRYGACAAAQRIESPTNPRLVHSQPRRPVRLSLASGSSSGSPGNGKQKRTPVAT